MNEVFVFTYLAIDMGHFSIAPFKVAYSGSYMIAKFKRKEDKNKKSVNIIERIVRVVKLSK